MEDKTLEERLEELEKKLQEKDNTIQAITESYETKLKDTEEKFTTKLDEINKAHNEEVRKIITGKRVVEEVKAKKGFFDSAVEKTLKLLQN